MRDRVILLFAALAALSAVASQGAAQSPTLPPIRPLGPVVAVASSSSPNIQGVRQLSDGRVVVEDETLNVAMLFEAALDHSSPVTDTSGAVGGIAGPYRLAADSTAFYSTRLRAIAVVDPMGRVARTLPSPSPLLAHMSAVGDGLGRIVYEDRRTTLSVADSVEGSGGHPIHVSLPLLRADLSTGRVDTIARVREPDAYVGQWLRDACGDRYYKPLLSPVDVADGWAVLSDGTIAVVRASDYHIDWIAPDGTRSASPPLPHAWHKLTDAEKTALADSSRRADADGTAMFYAAATRSRCEPALQVAKRPDYPAAADIADYEAPFERFGVTADGDDNIWIQEHQIPAGGGGAVYEIVNRRGVVIDRVQIPRNMMLLGFGPGVVYLKRGDGPRGETLVRAKVGG